MAAAAMYAGAEEKKMFWLKIEIYTNC